MMAQTCPESYSEALYEVHLAERMFSQAAPEYVESACLRLSGAYQRLNEVIKEMRSYEEQ